MADPGFGERPDGSFVTQQAGDVERLILVLGGDPTVAAAPTGAPRDATGAAEASADAPSRVVVPPFRVVVATDFASESFSATTVPLAVLTAFAQMFEAGSPVNLIFAVSHEAGEADLLGAQTLLGQVATTRALAGVSIESFDEAPAQPTYVSLIPTGDPHALVADLAKTLTAMHLLAETLAHPGRLRIALVHQHLVARVRDHRLAERLTGYREVDLSCS